MFSVSIIVTPSWFLRIMLMKSFDTLSGMFEVTGRVPDFIVFRRTTGPLCSTLELIVVESRVDDFVEFVFLFSFYLNRRRWFWNLRRKLVVFIRFEQ